MDILISSNLERLIFEISNRDAVLTSERMAELKKTGQYTISKQEKNLLDNEFYADYTDEEECKETIYDIFEEYGYVCDPHTAVAVNVYNKYIDYCNALEKTVVLSTASPYKFPQVVLEAISGKNEKDAFKASDKLCSYTAMPIAEQILGLKTKEKRFSNQVEKDEVLGEILDFIK